MGLECACTRAIDPLSLPPRTESDLDRNMEAGLRVEGVVGEVAGGDVTVGDTPDEVRVLSLIDNLPISML